MGVPGLAPGRHTHRPEQATPELAGVLHLPRRFYQVRPGPDHAADCAARSDHRVHHLAHPAEPRDSIPRGCLRDALCPGRLFPLDSHIDLFGGLYAFTEGAFPDPLFCLLRSRPVRHPRRGLFGQSLHAISLLRDALAFDLSVGDASSGQGSTHWRPDLPDLPDGNIDRVRAPGPDFLLYPHRRRYGFFRPPVSFPATCPGPKP